MLMLVRRQRQAGAVNKIDENATNFLNLSVIHHKYSLKHQKYSLLIKPTQQKSLVSILREPACSSIASCKRVIIF